MVRSFERQTKVVCQVASATWHCVPVHFSGRSFPCAGEECCCCPVRQPRITWFVGLVAENLRAVYEVSPSFVGALQDAAALLGLKDARGIVAVVLRDHARGEWRLDRCEARQLAMPSIAECEVIRAVASIYRLPPAFPGERFSPWFERVRIAQVYTSQAVAAQECEVRHG